MEGGRWSKKDKSCKEFFLTNKITTNPSIRDRVHRKKILALKKPVFSTFSNFFKKKKKL
jgi:hypothetical protein